MRRAEEGLQAVGATHLPDHDGVEGPADMVFHQLDGLGDDGAVVQPLLDHQRRAHLADAGDERVIVELQGIDQVEDGAVGVKLLQLQQGLIGITAAAGPEDPGPRRQVFQVFEAQPAAIHSPLPAPSRGAVYHWKFGRISSTKIRM